MANEENPKCNCCPIHALTMEDVTPDFSIKGPKPTKLEETFEENEGLCPCGKEVKNDYGTCGSFECK